MTVFLQDKGFSLKNSQFQGYRQITVLALPHKSSEVRVSALNMMEIPIVTVTAIGHEVFPKSAPTPIIKTANVANPRPMLPYMKSMISQSTLAIAEVPLAKLQAAKAALTSNMYIAIVRKKTEMLCARDGLAATIAIAFAFFFMVLSIIFRIITYIYDNFLTKPPIMGK